MKTKFTFKNHERSGSYRQFQLRNTDIKLKGKVVGLIAEDRFTAGVPPISIRFIVDSDEHPGWKWIALTKRCDKLEDARAFVTQNADVIVAKYKLHPFED